MDEIKNINDDAFFTEKKNFSNQSIKLNDGHIDILISYFEA